MLRGMTPDTFTSIPVMENDDVGHKVMEHPEGDVIQYAIYSVYACLIYTLHYITLHYITLHYRTLGCITLHCRRALRCIA